MNLKRLVLFFLCFSILAIIFLPSKSLAASPDTAFDAATVSQFSGWACDSDRFSQPLDIHFYKDAVAGGGGTFIGSTTANQTRSDLTGVCGGYTNHGYWWTPPSSLNDGNDHMIYAYAIGINSSGQADSDNPNRSKLMYRGGNLIYPNPAPDSRTQRTGSLYVNNGCSQSCNTNDNGANILVDDVKYRGSISCGWHGDCDWRVDSDSTCELGCTKSSYAGQLLTIPSNISQITAIYFDKVWIGREGSLQVGMASEIRVYRGTNRNTLIGSARADVPWTGGTAGSTRAIFSPPISVTPGENIYFELYSLDNLDTRDGGIVLLVDTADKTNNNSKDSYSGGYAYYHPDVRYQLSAQTNTDLAEVRVYGTYNPPVTLSGRVTNCSTGAGLSGIVVNQGQFLSPAECVIGTRTTDANGNFSFTNISYAQGFCIRGPSGGINGYTGPNRTYECQKAGYYANPDGCGYSPGYDMSADNTYDMCYNITAPLTPNVSPAPGVTCVTTSTYSGSEVYISWTNPGVPVSYVDISDSPSFSTYWNKYVGGASSTYAPTGFSSSPALSVNTPYYARLYNGQHGGTATFSIPSCNGPNITSLQLSHGATLNPTTFVGTTKTAGMTQGDGGANWLNPMTIRLNVTPGTLANSRYYVAFYDKSSGSQLTNRTTFISDIQSRINNNPKNGFLLRYDQSTGTYYAWISNQWLSLSTPKEIRDSSNNLLLTAASFSGGTNFASWKVTYSPSFGTKNLYTAAYAEDNNATPLADFESDCTTSSATCQLISP